MLQIQHIKKEYRTGTLVQKALDDVSLNLRDNEFVAILGPSGSGKTTLLNIIGGLDRYDSGDLIINGISTKKYKDRDWDSYRNHTIGFVFQSYNLIPHQTVLANVELALTISGVSKEVRRKKAIAALEKVGLGKQLHKRPSQMSGGQMQRVAIARALVNDPEILLADEPTGALDSDTSIQVMDLLQEVAKERLVVMVTHNPELAELYANRIVTLRDGVICSDTNPFEPDSETLLPPKHKNMGKSSMSFLTALSLSFNNLRTKKARTLLTSFAGSIGIIGIALILALSSGVNEYIQNMEEETLSEYPLQIQSTGFDLTSMMIGSQNAGKDSKDSGKKNEIKVQEVVTNMFSTMNSNDLASLKKYLDGGADGISDYTNAIEYSYSVTPQIYREDGDSIRQVHPDQSFRSLGLGASSNSIMSSMMSTNVFYEMPDTASLYENQYDLKAGHWPENYNECVLVLTSDGGMSDFLLYTLGLRDALELDEMVRQFLNEETVETPSSIGTYSYDDILGTTFRLVNSADCYEYDSQYQVWKDKSDNEDYMKKLVANGEKLTITGIVQPSPDSAASALTAGINYPASLTRHVVEEAKKSEIVKQQMADSSIDVFTNQEFGTVDQNSGLDILGTTFRLVNSADCYEYDSQYQVWKDKSDNEDYMKKLVANGEKLTITGIVQPSPDSAASALTAGINYPASLTRHVVEEAKKSEIVKQQMADSSIDVFTNQEFGTVDQNSGLDMDSFITVDEDKLQNAFQFDDSALSGAFSGDSMNLDFSSAFADAGSSMDLAGAIDLSQISLNFDGLPQLDLGQILSGLTLNVSEDGMQELASSLMEGYQGYASEHPEADYSHLQEDFVSYINSTEAQEILRRHIQTIIADGGGVSITQEQIQELIQRIFKGYQAYLIKMGYTDPEQFDAYLAEYLQTEEAVQIINDWISEVMQNNGNIEITSDQLTALATELSNGYLAYVKENGLPDPTEMGQHFIAYLNTADGQQRLNSGITKIVDLNGLQSQVSSALTNYMAGVMGSYSASVASVLQTQITSAMEQMMTQMASAIQSEMERAITQVGNSLQDSMGDAMKIDTDAFASAFRMNMTEDDMKELFASLSSSGSSTYEGNLQKLGYADFDEPSSISIYPKNFESKEHVVSILDGYNDTMEKEGKNEQVISYTDMVGTLMSSVTDIVNIISYVLIAFVGISLVVSSIMIGVITYISVLERKKEIGILRAIGASKRNISQVFNAETFIIGLCAGLIGIGLSLLLMIPGNLLIHHLADTTKVSASLPLVPALVLIALSVVLTLIGGLIPSKKAAKSDPVTALRTE